VELILISTEQEFKSELAYLNDMFNSGLEFFHVRKPNWTREKIQQYLSEIPPEFRNKIVVHQFHDQCLELNLKGIHLKSKDVLADNDAYTGFSISKSTHAIEELNAHKDLDYVFLSPFFNSISKEGYLANNALIKHSFSQRNVVALGGVNHANVKHLCKSGLMGVAMIGCIWQSQNPLQSYLEMREIITSENELLIN